jgi:membrane-bound lytic murein transglycosylase D
MKVSLCRFVLAVLALACPAFAERVELPSQGLENRVEFWKKVFTQYGENDVIVHDRIHVNLIYGVARRGEQASKITAAQKTLYEIRNNLETPDNLSAAAKEVREAILANGVPLTKASLENLRTNIHTQVGVKERFRNSIIRSGRYVESFQQIFIIEGLPAELALLPLVESSYETQARSSVGAAGIWQFTPGTGSVYLNMNKRVDERLDPAKATQAAARLLLVNYIALGNWPLAITAYNHGRAGMERARKEIGSSDLPKIIDEYKSPLFGYASMNFYSEFLAAVDVYKNREVYFGELTLDKPPQPRAPKPARTAPKAPAKLDNSSGK